MAIVATQTGPEDNASTARGSGGYIHRLKHGKHDAAIDPDLAAVAASLGGELPDVLAVRTIRIPCRKSDAVAVVNDMGTLTTYEQKARVVKVRPGDSRAGRYAVTGRIAGLLPWRGEFSYLLHEDGFHSADSTARRDGWRVAGGFVVYDVPSGGCEVMHYERYDLPRWAKPAQRLLTFYMRRSQRRELRIIHDLALLHSAEARARREFEPESA